MTCSTPPGPLFLSNRNDVTRESDITDCDGNVRASLAVGSVPITSNLAGRTNTESEHTHYQPGK